MLPWIQVYSNLPEHPKIYALVDRLKLRRNSEAVGIVVSLWLWAAKNAPDGDLSGFPDRAIAAALGFYRGRGTELCQALAETGWLDVNENGGYSIHNWTQYAGRLMEIVKRNREEWKIRSRRYREKTLVLQEKNKLESEASRVTHAQTGQDITEHNHNSLSESSSSWTKEKLSSLFSPRLALSPSAMEELLSLTDGMEEAVVRRALDIAQDNGKLVWGYVKGILKNWKSCGIRTLSQVEEREAKRKGRGGNPGAANAAGGAAPTVGAAEVAESRRRMQEILNE